MEPSDVLKEAARQERIQAGWHGGCGLIGSYSTFYLRSDYGLAQAEVDALLDPNSPANQKFLASLPPKVQSTLDCPEDDLEDTESLDLFGS